MLRISNMFRVGVLGLLVMVSLAAGAQHRPPPPNGWEPQCWYSIDTDVADTGGNAVFTITTEVNWMPNDTDGTLETIAATATTSTASSTWKTYNGTTLVASGTGPAGSGGVAYTCPVTSWFAPGSGFGANWLMNDTTTNAYHTMLQTVTFPGGVTSWINGHSSGAWTTVQITISQPLQQTLNSPYDGNFSGTDDYEHEETVDYGD